MHGKSGIFFTRFYRCRGEGKKTAGSFRVGRVTVGLPDDALELLCAEYDTGGEERLLR